MTHQFLPFKFTDTCLAPILACLVLCGSCWGQSAVAVQTLRSMFYQQYQNEQVTVRGWIAFEKPVISQTFKGYYLRDRYGKIILIRTTQPLPEITAEVLVTGVALYDSDTREVYLAETSRELVVKVDPNVPRANALAKAASAAIDADLLDTAARHLEELRQIRPHDPRIADLQLRVDRRRAELERRRTLTLLGGAALLILGALTIVLLMRRKRQDELVYAPDTFQPTDGSGDTRPWLGFSKEQTSAQTGMPPSVDDYRTVRVFKTTKVLPGYLAVMDGSIESDKIYLTDQNGRGEIEIGRDSPDVHGGIRIKDATNTLSRRQARIQYDVSERQFSLTNLAGAHSNPTVMNGREMKESEGVILQEGDSLLLGSVVMKFHRK